MPPVLPYHSRTGSGLNPGGASRRAGLEDCSREVLRTRKQVYDTWMRGGNKSHVARIPYGYAERTLTNVTVSGSGSEVATSPKASPHWELAWKLRLRTT